MQSAFVFWSLGIHWTSIQIQLKYRDCNWLQFRHRTFNTSNANCILAVRENFHFLVTQMTAKTLQSEQNSLKLSKSRILLSVAFIPCTNLLTERYHRTLHEICTQYHLHTNTFVSWKSEWHCPWPKVKEITKPANACYVQNSCIGKIKQETIRNCFDFLNLFLWYNKNGLNGINNNPELLSNL